MMNRARRPALRRRVTSSTLAVVVAIAAYAMPAAQPAAKKVLGVDDYTRWRSISGQEISGDGKWVAYTLQLTNTVREKDNLLLAFTDVPGAFDDEGDEVVKPVVLDPAKTENVPKGWVVSDRGAVSWSEDNTRVFFGIKEQTPAPDTGRKTTDRFSRTRRRSPT